MEDKYKSKKTTADIILLMLLILFVAVPFSISFIYWGVIKYSDIPERCTALRIINEVDETSNSILDFIDKNPKITEINTRLADKYAILPLRMLSSTIGDLENSCKGNIKISGKGKNFSITFEGIPPKICEEIMSTNEKDLYILGSLRLVGRKNRVCYKCPKEGCSIEWKNR